MSVGKFGLSCTHILRHVSLLGEYSTCGAGWVRGKLLGTGGGPRQQSRIPRHRGHRVLGRPAGGLLQQHGRLYPAGGHQGQHGMIGSGNSGDIFLLLTDAYSTTLYFEEKKR